MKEIRLAFMGDIMPGGVLHYSKDKFIEDNVLKHLNWFDLRVATLECALGDSLNEYYDGLTEQGKNKNIIFAKNDSITKLKNMNIDLVTIANNHIYDLGEKGLRNTINILEENNIKYVGAGMNIEEASRPAIFNIKDKSFAFIGCSEIIPSSPHPAGINKSGYYSIDLKKINNQIVELKKRYDYVFVLPHWGIEHVIFPPYRCKKIAYSMINAGADGIMASHSHHVQPTIYYKNKPIVFSMGNFLFPSRYITPPRHTIYPEKEDLLKDVPVAVGIVKKSITHLSLKTWTRNVNNIGLIAGLCITPDKIKYNPKLTCLNKNRVIFYDDMKFSKKLKYSSFIIKCWYPPTLFIIRKTTKFLNKLKLLLNKLKSNPI